MKTVLPVRIKVRITSRHGSVSSKHLECTGFPSSVDTQKAKTLRERRQKPNLRLLLNYLPGYNEFIVQHSLGNWCSYEPVAWTVLLRNEGHFSRRLRSLKKTERRGLIEKGVCKQSTTYFCMLRHLDHRSRERYLSSDEKNTEKFWLSRDLIP